MRGVETQKTKIRQRVFTEIARMAYEGKDPKEELDELPFKIVPGEIASYRDSIFLERAIVGERLRVAMGMGLRKMTEHSLISKGVDASMIEEKYYEPPLINVIKFACHRCPDKRVFVTNGCQGCLEHPCQEVCPKGAISMVNGRSFIDQEKCIKCGKCMDACQYNAIIRQERPCKLACGVGAIGIDQYGRAEIDQKKCVACGMCLVSCPFAAIVDKGQIYQTVITLKSETPVYAIVAPAIAGQFGPDFNYKKIRPALKALGFSEVAEVAVGADLCTIEEANHFLEEVPGQMPFMGTSCCPAWSIMAKKFFPDYAQTISMALTPMVLTARLIKKEHPEVKVCFIGPCLSKKQEASRRSIKSYVDFCLTFEELEGMFEAKGIDFAEIPEDPEPLCEASADGRGFAQEGGVASAVQRYINKILPDREVKTEHAAGLAECKRMMTMATKTHKYDGYLLEGMACPGGCIAGAGTLQPIQSSRKSLAQSKKEALYEQAGDQQYASWISDLENIDSYFEEEQEKLEQWFEKHQDKEE
ncbi:MAG: 4Fe-4S dicluster domain-containing protein [Bilifractor sp.]